MTHMEHPPVTCTSSSKGRTSRPPLPLQAHQIPSRRGGQLDLHVVCHEIMIFVRAVQRKSESHSCREPWTFHAIWSVQSAVSNSCNPFRFSNWDCLWFVLCLQLVLCKKATYAYCTRLSSVPQIQARAITSYISKTSNES